MRVGTVGQPAEWSDAALVQAIANAGDKQAFEELFARYAPKLKAHYARSGQSDSSSEDLIQDVMLSVWRHAQGYRPELASVSTWIFRIARNRFIDVVRKRRFVEIDADELAPASGDEAPPVDETLVVRQLSVRVELALEELPEEQAEVVRGSYFKHESASEMAERLEIPIGTVKSRMRAAMQFLQRRLFEGGEP